MNFLIIILLFGLYLVVSRVIVTALNKHGFISDYTIKEFIFVPYLFLPITLFLIGIDIASTYLINLFHLDK